MGMDSPLTGAPSMISYLEKKHYQNKNLEQGHHFQFKKLYFFRTYFAEIFCCIIFQETQIYKGDKPVE